MKKTSNNKSETITIRTGSLSCKDAEKMNNDRYRERQVIDRTASIHKNALLNSVFLFSLSRAIVLYNLWNKVTDE